MIPIVFFQTSHSPACDMAIRMACRNNPDSDVHVITDQPFQYGKAQSRFPAPNNLRAHDIKDLEGEDCHLFNQFYPQSPDHMSTNPREFEYYCFYRWFLIKSLVKKEKIQRFFATDSDVLLYCDINEEAKKFENYQWTTTNAVSCGITFVNDVGVLNKFCELSNAIFSGRDKFNYNKCLYHFVNLQQNGKAGGVNDMTIWEILSKDAHYNPGMVGETSAVIDDKTFDHNFNASDGYLMDNETGTKMVKWQNDMPFCFNLFLKRWVKFSCIHFQGNHAKRLMREYVR